MGIVIRQSLRSSIIAYLGVLIGYINILWLYPYYMNTEQVGLMRLIQSSAFLLATFGQIGMPQTTIKFFPDLQKNKGFLGLIMLIGLTGFVLLSSLSLVFKQQLIGYFSEESALFVDYFQVTLIVTLFLVQFQILEAYSRSHLKIVIPTLIRDVQLRLLTTVVVLLFGFQVVDFDTMVKLLVILYASILLSIMIYLRRLNVFQLSLDFRFISGKSFTKFIRYGLYSLLGAGGTQIVLQIDSVMVSGELGLDATGVYTIAFFIGVVIEMPKRSITQISSALISQAFQKNDMAQVKKLYQQTSINQMIIGTLLLIGIWSNLENIYHFIPNNEAYLAGMNVVLFIGLGKLSDMIFGTNGEIIVMSKYYRFNVLGVSALALLTIVLNLWLIPLYGIEGAAIASLVAMLSFNVLKYIFVYLRFGMQPFTAQTLIFIFIAAGAILINSIVPKIDTVLIDILARSSVITTVIIGGVWLFKISPEMNGLLTHVLSKLYKSK